METASDLELSFPSLSWRGVRRGFRAHLGALFPVAAFAAAFGAAATGYGLDGTTIAVMSATVFAGSSQFAVLDLWREPMPYLAILIMTLAINARHLAYGATLRDYLGRLGVLPRAAILFFLNDANWAGTKSAEARGEKDAGFLLGGGLIIWVAWLIGTIVGATGSRALGDADRLGVDALMPAFFACALMGRTPTRPDVARWAVAGAAVLALGMLLSAHWAVMAAALVACAAIRR